MTNIQKIRHLLKTANICKIIPGTVIMEAEIYSQILALLPCETCGGTGKTSKLFDKCPECGCKEYTSENLAGEGYRQCLHCHQDWWTDTEYDISCPDCQS